MSVRLKLLVILLFVALLPLGVSAVTLLYAHQRAYERQTVELYRLTVKKGALLSRLYLDGAITGLDSLAGKTVRWSQLDDQERLGALWLVYRDSNDIVVASLLDEKVRGLGPSAYFSGSTPPEKRQNHLPATLPLLRSFAERIPFEQARLNGIALGAPFTTPGFTEPIIPVAISVRADADAEGWVVAVGLSLRELCRRLADEGDSAQLLLIDSNHKVLCSTKAHSALSDLDRALAQRLRGDPAALRYADSRGVDIIAAVQPGPRDLWVVAQSPTEKIFAASQRMGQHTLYWLLVGVLVALVAGLYLTRSVNRPLLKLAKASRELARGNYACRVNMGERNEFGRLATTFNMMCNEIEARDEKIQAYSQTLEQQVDKRTSELRAAYNQLQQAQKDAAVSSFGAGVAQEIASPLTGLLGVLQWVHDRAKRDPARRKEAALLAGAETEALRIRSMVKRLQSLCLQLSKDHLATIPVHGMLNATIRLLQGKAQSVGARIHRDYAADEALVRGSFTQLQQAVLQVLSNAIDAVQRDGQVTLRTTKVRQTKTDVRIIIENDGEAILPEHIDRIFVPFFTTKNEPQADGLGLTIARRILRAHGGDLKVDSSATRGARFVLELPSAPHTAGPAIVTGMSDSLAPKLRDSKHD